VGEGDRRDPAGRSPRKLGAPHRKASCFPATPDLNPGNEPRNISKLSLQLKGVLAEEGYVRILRK
ncbi:hypothetical protein DXT76_19955, partial [Halobacillus trueperi]